MTTGWSTARGRVYSTRWWWAYEVIDSYGKVVMRDTTATWRAVLTDCLSGVSAVRRIENVGHELNFTFDELVETADTL